VLSWCETNGEAHDAGLEWTSARVDPHTSRAASCHSGAVPHTTVAAADPWQRHGSCGVASGASPPHRRVAFRAGGEPPTTPPHHSGGNGVVGKRQRDDEPTHLPVATSPLTEAAHVTTDATLERCKA
jgi:hypothetical protein